MMTSWLRSRSSWHVVALSTKAYTPLTKFSCGVIGISAPNSPVSITISLFSIKFVISLFSTGALGICKATSAPARGRRSYRRIKPETAKRVTHQKAPLKQMPNPGLFNAFVEKVCLRLNDYWFILNSMILVYARQFGQQPVVC